MIDAKEIREARLSARLTVKQAARANGVGRSTWGRWEAGESVPSPLAERNLRKWLDRLTKGAAK